MGKIKLATGETIFDRRREGARLRLDIGDWVKIYSTIGSILIAGAFFVSNINFTVRHHEEQISKLEMQAEINAKNIEDNTMEIQAIKGTLSKIDSNVEKLLSIHLMK